MLRPASALASITVLLPALLPALLLGGCGTPSQPLPMAVAPADALQIRGWVPEALQRQVALAPVLGGLATGRWWGSQVSAAALQQALESSLHAVGMRPVAPEPGPRFELRAELLHLEQPRVPALGVTVGAAVHYMLVEKASGRVVYERRIANTDDARLSEALVSPSERLSIANERVLRANIGLLLRDLVTLRP